MTNPAPRLLLIDEEVLDAYLALEKMRGIGLASLRTQEKAYETFLKIVLFFLADEERLWSRAQCLNRLQEFLQERASWLKASAQSLFEALLQEQWIAMRGESVEVLYQVRSHFTQERALSFLGAARQRQREQRDALREALRQKNRRVNAKPALRVDPLEDIGFMREALKEAQRGLASGEVPVGAVLVREGRIVARAVNRVVADHDPSAHAEMLVLREAAMSSGFERLSGATLYVTLEPCPMCTGAALLARVSRIVWGADDVKAGACGGAFALQEYCTMNHRIAYTAGVLREPCQALLERFFQSRREGVL